MSVLHKLIDKNIAKPPYWLRDNCMYATYMGSIAYGVSNESSDMDVYGFCIPPKEYIFPHISGEILGFDDPTNRFDQWQEHGLQYGEKTYDCSVYSIVKYFKLCSECNPNMIDSLFTPRTCVVISTKIGEMVRENRRLFLHKGAWHKFKGYSYAQLSKIKSKKPVNEKRKQDIIDFGYDGKYAYHLVRLLNEVEQILIEHDLDITRNADQLRSIRKGEWTLQQIEEYFQKKELDLESLYTKSTLRYSPDKPAIKQLLLNCLEEHYGSLSNCIVNPDKYMNAINSIKDILKHV